MTSRPPRFSLWTVYAHPRDYPHEFVARRFELATPTGDVITAPTLAALRAKLGVMADVSMCIPRDATDDPVIVECWI